MGGWVGGRDVACTYVPVPVWATPVWFPERPSVDKHSVTPATRHHVASNAAGDLGRALFLFVCPNVILFDGPCGLVNELLQSCST